MDKKGEKFTVKSFHIIVISAYVVIAVIAALLWHFNYSVTTVLSFLGITVSPSAPAFLAIFLSQYSEQANATRKSELLYDIQIRKEISKARENHYNDIKNEVQELKSHIEAIYNSSKKGECRIDSFQLPDLDIDNDFLEKYNRAFLHLSELTQRKGGDITIDFLKSEINVVNVNSDISKIIDQLRQILNDVSKKHSEVILTEQTQTPKNGASMSEYTAIYSIFYIWNEGKDRTRNMIKWINTLLNGKLPDRDVSEDSMHLYSTSVNYINCTIAKTESFRYGLEVLDIISETLGISSLQTEFVSLLQKKKEIDYKRELLLSQIDHLIKEIDIHKYAGSAVCCPFPEYSGKIF